MAEAANRDSAVECLRRARELLHDTEEVDFDRALRLLRKAEHLWPTLPGVQEALQEVSREQAQHAQRQQQQEQMHAAHAEQQRLFAEARARHAEQQRQRQQEQQQHAEQQRLFAEARARMQEQQRQRQQAQPAPSTPTSGPIDRILNAGACHYAVLGLARGASEGEIKKAYHRACLAVHPDKCEDARATQAFQAVQRAFDVLKDATTRNAYNANPRAAAAPPPAQWRPSWTPPSAASAPDPTEAQIRAQLWATKVPGLKEFCRRMGIAAGNKKKEQLVGELYDRLAAYQPVENGLAHLQRMVDEHKRKDKLEAELRCASFLPEVWDSAAALRKLVTEAQTLGVAAGLFRAATQRCATLEAAERAAAAAKEAEERRAAAAERERRQREAEALAAAERERQRRIVEANERAAREERERRARAEAEAKARAEAEARARRQAAERARAAEAEAEARVRAEAAARAEARAAAKAEAKARAERETNWSWRVPLVSEAAVAAAASKTAAASPAGAAAASGYDSEPSPEAAEVAERNRQRQAAAEAFQRGAAAEVRSAEQLRRRRQQERAAEEAERRRAAAAAIAEASARIPTAAELLAEEKENDAVSESPFSFSATAAAAEGKAAAERKAADEEAMAKARFEAVTAELARNKAKADAAAKAEAEAAASFAAAREEAKAAEARRQRDFMQSFVRRQSSDGAGPSAAAAAPAAADTKTPVAPTNKRARPEEAPSVAQQATREEKPKVRKPRYSSAREAKNDRKNGVKQASIGAFFGS